jgi:cysteinyl-tRNA synthetase
MALQLYNTLTRRKEAFQPIDPDRVTMYVCGPTVYNYAHIGNARPAVVFDVLARLLRHLYPELVYARNITDVEDKINKAAADEGVSIDVISSRYKQAYDEDMGALGVLPPDIEPHATAHIAEMIAMMAALIDKGHAYVAEGHVLFNVPSYDDYGQLSRRNRDEMIAGARVEVAPYKQDPADFVLWKPSADDQPGWDSPWGRGRPGWHIECSAMVEKNLGREIDIHGGGLDLTFPHHENEIAQSVCCYGGRFVRTWLHNGFVNVDAEKMSKSIGNVLLVRDLLDDAPGEAIRLALLSAHYRQPLDWSEEGLAQAKRNLDRLYGGLRDLLHVSAEPEPPQAVVDALADDLNTPLAMAEMFKLLTAANTATTDAEKSAAKSALLGGGWLLGLLQDDPEAWFGHADVADVDADQIELLILQRNEARAAKDFAQADRIRDELAAMGVVLEDSADGTRWKLAG